MRAAISDVATGPFDGYIKFPIAVGPFQTQQDKFMTEDSKSKTAAMQGGGFYNRNSTLQAATLTSALPLLEDAARSIAVDGDRPLVIVDYGCSKGRNSMAPMRAGIEAWRVRPGDDRAGEGVNTDVPAYDYNSLFPTWKDETGLKQ